MKRKIISLLFAVVLIVMTVIPFTVGAVTVVIDETVNVAAARQNMHGHGYEWANRTSTLTLDGCNIVTKDDYGMKLPGECTVILKGNNHICAEKYALSCAGNVIFKGDGTLVLEAGEYGLYLISQDNTTKVRILSGKYDITAGKCGVFSEYTDFSLAGGEITCNTAEDGGQAIFGRIVNLVGGSFKSDGSVEATHTLLCDSVDLDIKSGESALVAKKLTVRNIEFDGMDEYAGENEVVGHATKRWHSKRILFSDMPGWIDYILLVAVLAACAACIVLPILHKKKKTKELYERLKAEGYDTYEK